MTASCVRSSSVSRCARLPPEEFHKAMAARDGPPLGGLRELALLSLLKLTSQSPWLGLLSGTRDVLYLTSRSAAESPPTLISIKFPTGMMVAGPRGSFTSPSSACAPAAVATKAAASAAARFTRFMAAPAFPAVDRYAVDAHQSEDEHSPIAFSRGCRSFDICWELGPSRINAGDKPS
jgi:hypothetical protein